MVKETHGESVVSCLVLANEVNQLAIASARDFACGVRNKIVRLPKDLVGVERLLQALALLAGTF